MIEFMKFIASILDQAKASVLISIIATLLALLLPTICIIFLVDGIKLAASSRIVIKGNTRTVKKYPIVVDGVMQCETQGLIRSNIARTTTSASKFEPDALKREGSTTELQAEYNYDESDGIPPVDRPLFKPKDM